MDSIKKFIAEQKSTDFMSVSLLCDALQEISERLDAHDRQLKEQDDWIKALEKVMASYEKKEYPVAQAERSCDECEYEKHHRDVLPCVLCEDWSKWQPKQPKAHDERGCDECLQYGQLCVGTENKAPCRQFVEKQPKQAQEQDERGLDIRCGTCRIDGNAECDVVWAREHGYVCWQPKAQEQLWICNGAASCFCDCRFKTPQKDNNYHGGCIVNYKPVKIIPYAQEQGGKDKKVSGCFYDHESCDVVCDLRARLAEAQMHIALLSRQRSAICNRLETVWGVGPEVTGDLMSWEWVDQDAHCYEELQSQKALLETENAEFAKGVVAMTKSLDYIKGICDRGGYEGTDKEKEYVDLRILGYVKKLEKENAELKRSQCDLSKCKHIDDLEKECAVLKSGQCVSCGCLEKPNNKSEVKG